MKTAALRAKSQRGTVPASVLCEPIARILLSGYTAPGWTWARLSLTDQRDVKRLLSGRAEYWAELWTTHRPLLLATAKRLGIAPSGRDGLYFAQRVAIKVAERAERVARLRAPRATTGAA